MATINQIRQALTAKPFRAFTMHLTDGRACLVRHPDFVAIPPTPRFRELVYWSGDEMHLIDPTLIVSIVLPSSDAAATSQGATPPGPAEPDETGTTDE